MNKSDFTNIETTTSLHALARELEEDLLTRHGPIMSGKALSGALGYPTNSAFRQALARNTVPVPVFKIAHRRGKFALCKDVAIWVASQRQGADTVVPIELTSQKEMPMKI